MLFERDSSAPWAKSDNRSSRSKKAMHLFPHVDAISSDETDRSIALIKHVRFMMDAQTELVDEVPSTQARIKI